MLKEDLIEVQQLSKIYRVANKNPGLVGTLRHFLNRKTIDVPAVKGVNFSIKQGEIVGFL